MKKVSSPNGASLAIPALSAGGEPSTLWILEVAFSSSCVPPFVAKRSNNRARRWSGNTNLWSVDCNFVKCNAHQLHLHSTRKSHVGHLNPSLNKFFKNIFLKIYFLALLFSVFEWAAVDTLQIAYPFSRVLATQTAGRLQKKIYSNNIC